MKRILLITNLVVIAATLTGCGTLPQAQVDSIYTAAAQTMAVTLTYNAVQSEVFAEATHTAEELATLKAPTSTEMAAPLPSETPLPANTATPEILIPTATATLYGKASVTAAENTNCRTGPTAYFDYQSALMAGQTAEVVARDSNTNWYQIVDPEDSTQKCWVTNKTTSLSGDLSLIPVITVPITPQPYYSISGWLSDNDYEGTCPVTITAYGKIKANTGSYDDITYGFSNNMGLSLAGGTTEFKKAGSQTFSSDFTISSDTDGYIRFNMYDPDDLSTGKLKLHVDCE